MKLKAVKKTSPESPGSYSSSPATAASESRTPTTHSPQEVAKLDRWSRQNEHREAITMLHDAGDDWVNAKRAYVGKPDQPMLKLMNFRAAYVNAVLEAILKRYVGANPSAVGSQNETSDYDVSLLGGEQTWSAMKEFNDTFRSIWGKESGIVFDTNVYVGTIPPPTSDYGDSWIMQGGPPGESKEWQYVQESASLAKMRRFMDQGEWKAHVTAVTDGVMAQPLSPQRRPGKRFSQTTHARGSFSVAEAMYDSYVRSVARTLKSEGYPGPPTQSDDDFVRSMEHREENAVMRARNTMYTLHTRGAQDTERSFLKHYASEPKPWRSKASVSELNANACLYAMEAYHSAGAVFDVVFNQQAGLDGLDVTFSDYVQSFNEQVGDTLKDLHHYESDPGKAFYQSAKYIRRMTIAADALLKHCGVSLPIEATKVLDDFRKLGDNSGTLLRLRGGGDEKFAKYNDAEKSAAASQFTSEVLHVDTIPEFKAKLLQLAKAIHILRYTLTAPSFEAAGGIPVT